MKYFSDFSISLWGGCSSYGVGQSDLKPTGAQTYCPGWRGPFKFLGRLGRLELYIPQLSINVIAKFPGILTESAGLARLICRSTAYRLWFQSALAPTRSKL
jgi:hypothetical protein